MENTNTNTNYEQKQIFDGLLEQSEYEAVIVKAVPMDPKPNMPPSIRVMFKIDFPECVAFVSGFMNQTFKSGDKTAVWLKNLGIEPADNRTPIEQLKGKKCRIYVTPGKKVWSANLNKEIQYHKIGALTPLNKVLPSVTKPQVQQANYNVGMVNTSAPVQQPIQQNPFINSVQQPNVGGFTQQQRSVAEQLAGFTQPVSQQPMNTFVQPQVQPMVQPMVQPVTPQPVQPVQQPVQQVQQPVQVAQPVVQQPVQQPLPTQPVNLDF